MAVVRLQSVAEVQAVDCWSMDDALMKLLVVMVVMLAMLVAVHQLSDRDEQQATP